MQDRLMLLLVGLIVGAIISGLGTWWIAGQKIAKLQTELRVAIDANEVNTQTIKMQKEEIEKATKSCSSRIAIKDTLIKRLMVIDNLGGEYEETNFIDSDNPGDAILGMLGRMWKDSDESGVYQTDYPSYTNQE